MHLNLDDFCEILKGLKKTNTEKALAVLWFHDRKCPDVFMTAGDLARVLDNHHVGSPNQTALWNALCKSKFVSRTKLGFVLKPGSRKLIREWLPYAIDGIQPAMDHATGYLPVAVWKDTRGYIEEVCRQLNGCFNAAYYDAAAVMLRRLLETLIIEAYEHLTREKEIKDASGNYFLLVDLVDRACGEKSHRGINLGRNSKATLKDAREIGNFSAHSRRFLAKAGDLTKFQTGVRALAEELIHIANLAPKRA